MKHSFANLAVEQEDEKEIQPVELLTTESKRDPFEHNTGRKTALDESVMVGIRMTKRQRKALKQLAFDLDLSIQEVVRQAVVLFRDSKSLR